MKKTLVFSLLCLFSLSTFAASDLFLSKEEQEKRNVQFSEMIKNAMRVASGADIVGNGGGIAEQNMSFVYRNLDKTVSYCINLPNCGEGADKVAVLKLIRNTILEKRDAPSRLVFLTSDHFNGLLSQTADYDERVAKTGFSADFPIFFNLAEIQENQLSSDLSAMVGILVHEVGHQVGVASHSFLDELAAEVRTAFILLQQRTEITYHNNTFSLMVVGGVNAYDYQQVLLSVDGEPLKVESLVAHYKCTTPGTRLVGAKISSMVWDRPVNGNETLVMRAKGNVDFSCEMRSKTIITEQARVDYVFSFAGILYPGERLVLKLVDQVVEVKTDSPWILFLKK